MKKNKNNSYSVKFSAQVEGTCGDPTQSCGRRGCTRMKYNCKGRIPSDFIVPVKANEGIDWKTSSAVSTKTSYQSLATWVQSWEGDPSTGHIRPRSMGRTAGILMIVFGVISLLLAFGTIGCLRNRSCRQGLGGAGVLGNMFGGSSSGYNYSMFNPLKDL